MKVMDLLAIAKKIADRVEAESLKNKVPRMEGTSQRSPMGTPAQHRR